VVDAVLAIHRDKPVRLQTRTWWSATPHGLSDQKKAEREGRASRTYWMKTLLMADTISSSVATFSSLFTLSLIL
jgi:hypothetical protein